MPSGFFVRVLRIRSRSQVCDRAITSEPSWNSVLATPKRLSKFLQRAELLPELLRITNKAECACANAPRTLGPDRSDRAEYGVRADFVPAHVVLGVAAVVVSLFAYFFYMVTAFTAIGALLIGLANGSTVEKTLHYPRPIIEQSIIEQTFTTTNPQPRDLPDAPRTKEEVPARNKPEKNINDSRVVSVGKADTAKRKREIKNKTERLAQLHKPREFAHQHGKYEGHGYAMALGYAAGSGYRPGLDAQR